MNPGQVYYPLGHGEEMSEGEYQASQIDPPPPEREYGTWRTKDGRVIEIAKMTEQHLGNSIAMLERKKLTHLPQYTDMTEEWTRRGLIATAQAATAVLQEEEEDEG